MAFLCGCGLMDDFCHEHDVYGWTRHNGAWLGAREGKLELLLIGRKQVDIWEYTSPIVLVYHKTPTLCKNVKAMTSQRVSHEPPLLLRPALPTCFHNEEE